MEKAVVKELYFSFYCLLNIDVQITKNQEVKLKSVEVNYLRSVFAISIQASSNILNVLSNPWIPPVYGSGTS
ncbi:hypothetical protein LX78_00836 [Xanthomarina spongicola]|uniref:Uncharacterized protein n=1 Tax=Xanthomarina spongicola TaxID=570520 RepID=A0A316DQQ1_9FLAO|nr:hypothetical protein LX78_00836 [Xanthomarina spongicola]